MSAATSAMNSNINMHEARFALLIRAQEAFLQKNNYVVRRTFIDPESQEAEETVLPRVRSQSLPPRLHDDINNDNNNNDEDINNELHPPREVQEQELKTQTFSPAGKGKGTHQISLFDAIPFCRADTETHPGSSETETETPPSPRSVCSGFAGSPCSSASTTACSEADDHAALTECLNRLAELVADECSFMRVQGHRVLVADGLDALRAARSKNAAMICVFVQGLPWTKRAKWRYPLLRSAAQALERIDVEAVVTGGNLFVNLPGVGRVQIDFAAAR